MKNRKGLKVRQCLNVFVFLIAVILFVFLISMLNIFTQLISNQVQGFGLVLLLTYFVGATKYNILYCKFVVRTHSAVRLLLYDYSCVNLLQFCKIEFTLNVQNHHQGEKMNCKQILAIYLFIQSNSTKTDIP